MTVTQSYKSPMHTEDNRQLPHLPVLVKQAMEGLYIRNNKVYVDCTFGAGGHTKAILSSNPSVVVIGIDRDANNKYYAEQIKQQFGKRFHFINGLFSEIDKAILKLGFGSVDGILYDLGFSSMQVDSEDRGFSLRKNGKLNMQMGCSALTADHIINQYSQKQLADIIFQYGEEKDSRKIAKAIVMARNNNVIENTVELVKIIEQVIPYRKGSRLHPATRTFQAIRIETNNELNELKNSLHKAFNILNPEGRICVISFHSLEDRIVKQFGKSGAKQINNAKTNPLEWLQYKPELEKENSSGIVMLSKKPITPLDDECSTNPRARSAKLRVISKASKTKSN